MKLCCSAGHRFNTNDALNFMHCASDGGRCPMVTDYGRIAGGQRTCRRVLREEKPLVQIIAHKRCGEWTWSLAKVGFQVAPAPNPIESSREFPSERAAVADARKVAAGCGLKIVPSSFAAWQLACDQGRWLDARKLEREGALIGHQLASIMSNRTKIRPKLLCPPPPTKPPA